MCAASGLDLVQQACKKDAKRPWKIPTVVEKGYEIPIAIVDVRSTPEFGNFERLGMDVFVNATWLALYFAKVDEDAEAATAIRSLILDWPFDYFHIAGTTAEEQEENKFKWACNMSSRVEKIREFVGL